MTVQIKVWVLASLIFFGFSSLAWGEPAGAWTPLMAKAKSQKVRVIVQFRDSDTSSKSLSTSQARSQRTHKIESMQNEFLNSLAARGHQPRRVKKFNYMPFVAMEADSAMLNALQANPNVVGIEEDVMFRANLTTSNPLVGGDIIFNDGYTGAGQTVAILDTGVDKTHSFFGGRVVSEACYSTNNVLQSATSVCPGGVEATTAPNSGLNCDALDPSINGCNHGTHVAGIAAGNGAGLNGMARSANLIAIQVFTKISNAATCSPQPSPCVVAFQSDIIQGGERVLALANTFNIASINLSLGGAPFTSTCDLFFPSQKALIDNLRAQGIATIIASGNQGSTNGISSPACISSAISVGSTSKSDVISSFSNSASFLSLLAPGQSIRSSVPENNFSFFSGTSMAAPHVAGAWASIKQALEESGTNATVADILTSLQTTGIPVDHPSNGFTFPRIQVDQAIDSLVANPVFSDFDSNAQSDILAYNTGSGEIGQLFIDNALIQSVSSPGAILPATGWAIHATGDFNKDRNADLLLFNTLNNQVAIILMNGSTALSAHLLLDLTGTGFALNGAGDFDGDSQSDLLVFNATTGELGAVIINNNAAVSFISISTADPGVDWDLFNGDFNGDGFDDVLAFNPDLREVVVVLWDGVVATPGLVTTLGADQIIAETADFTGDHNTDLLTLNTTTGATTVITLDGTTLDTENPAFPINLAGNWSLLNAGQYSDNALADYLLVNSVSGDVRIVLLNNGAFVSQHDLFTLDLPAGWTLLSGKP